MDDGVSEQEMGLDMEEYVKPKSISGKELPADWPKILTPQEEAQAYGVLKNEDEDPSEPPKTPHIEKLSYELTSGDKRLRFFAAFHQKDMTGPEDPNMVQYDILEKKFQESPPDLVLYEGFIDDPNHPITREEAMKLGEPAWMMYLVQQHNKNPDAKHIDFESGDASVNRADNQTRDTGIITNTAEKFEQYNKIDMVFGSGHAIREKPAWQQFFE